MFITIESHIVLLFGTETHSTRFHHFKCSQLNLFPCKAERSFASILRMLKTALSKNPGKRWIIFKRNVTYLTHLMWFRQLLHGHNPDLSPMKPFLLPKKNCLIFTSIEQHFCYFGMEFTCFVIQTAANLYFQEPHLYVPPPSYPIPYAPSLPPLFSNLPFTLQSMAPCLPQFT